MELLAILAVGVIVYASWPSSESNQDSGGGSWDGSTDTSADYPPITDLGAADMTKVKLPADVSATIDKYAAQYGVDPNLAKAQAYAESGGKQSAVSSVGAIGVFQLMPTTAAGLGVNPNDQEQNIQGGVKYLSQLLTRYNGDQTLALAAYNAGPGNVAKYGGVPPFTETKNYIKKILGYLGA